MYSMDIPSINEDVEHIPVEGRNGSLTERKGTFPDRVLNFGFDLNRMKNEDLQSFTDRLIYIQDIFDNCIGKELVCFSNLSYKYIIKNIKKDIIENTLCHDIKVEVTCEPFKYLANEPILSLFEHTTIYYTGTYEGQCNIKIYGHGNIQLTINSETIQINNVNEYVELDSKLLLCLNPNRTSKTRDMIGNFPILKKGLNKISWSGDVSRVVILPRTAFK